MDKKRIIGFAVAGAVLLAGAAGLLRAPLTQLSAGTDAAPSARERAASGDARFTALPKREAIGKPRGQPFESRSWAPVASSAAGAAVAPPKPTAPPMPYRVAGQVSHDGVMQVVLARADHVVTVQVGDRVEDNYRVESIRPDAVTLEYLPLGERQQIPVAGLLLETPRDALAAAAGTSPRQAPAAAPDDQRAAQLRWQGPKQVQAGNNFDVTLKLNSTQPVRALPLELSYDAKLLEPVAVRPGDLFAEGRFTYRVNPAGSIFVGASGNGAPAADADFLVVTFRPIRSGDAELRLSSVALQGEAGRAIAHEPPAAFRTAIVQ